ncbi:MAG: Asp-tRNA(Asn)/Glu-tRNA(Gln) amidotransferase subunit GatB [Proteobacteria bacterium]|nr:Asp-tRNA(Asn)/Glu-tRNA(Gln) amidotransferase subunit GatB [Pseudomonadota bacterium]MBU1583727.1 Asp-tRNA(Asn)/Glu-tRNA(Gln) amidotransferase subunit GatB [Pseudomonadota bacterium]MBU2452542.1 Asp-tRNA(Asn)/Glu-tRNA(Gln) amidotransferase subunit GatB [Pseudomonadota bacterium]MBU2628744.1 Asp-tRNA(Asn)/Glu-tRNA(Gln) amidotransferase subunit GatB [Pseudomonadota bacterium]
MQYEPVIGLEVHAQLKTKTKIFCSCSTQFGKSPNANTCPVCTGMPGVLPVLNKLAVTFAIKGALATNCTINRESRFDRKNYFYPDLPKGYQISQYAFPIAEHGYLEIEIDETTLKKIGITRIHMEEDAGKLIHDPARAKSMVDLNRTGVPLIEIVSEPDIRSPKEAGAYLRKLHSILKYIDVCDGNMEEGSFRCDANISLRPLGQKEFGIRAELKNLNSFKHVEKAILYEIERQTYVLQEGKPVIQETRLWDPVKNKTFSMRGKEEAHDYRYFPDPDLVPLIVDDQWIEDVKKNMPELPDEKHSRFMKNYSLSDYEARVLTSSIELADFFEETVTQLKDKKQAANWTMTTFLSMLNSKGIPVSESPVKAKAFSKLLFLLENQKITAGVAKTVFEEMVETLKDPEAIVKSNGLEQVSNQAELETIILKIINKNPNEVAAYREGKTKLFSFFMGQVMKETRGKADPKVVTLILKSNL